MWGPTWNVNEWVSFYSVDFIATLTQPKLWIYNVFVKIRLSLSQGLFLSVKIETNRIFCPC